MHVAALNGFTRILDLLLRHGANLEALDDARSTPFAMAAFNFHKSAMRLLADRGANLMPVARDEVTPLNFACIMGNDEKVRLLLQLGASVGGSRNAVVTKEGETCLPQVMGYMWKSPPAPDLMRESESGTAPGCGWGRNLAIAEMLIAAGVNLAQMHENMLPLHFAVSSLHLQRGQAPQRGGLPAPIVGGGVLPPADGEAPTASRRVRDGGGRVLPRPAANRRELRAVPASGPRGRGGASDGGR